tara:strand:+ start:74 stop:1249 length:1176 start_codon:yes stop_codon:yes gene_type:complete
MPFYKFGKNDLLVNTIEAHPQSEFFVHNKKIFYNQEVPETGSNTTPVKHVPSGHISLHELNIDRPTNHYIYPFMYKGSGLASFRTVTLDTFNLSYDYGDQISGDYRMSASISVDRIAGSDEKIKALKNTSEFYRKLSQHYEFNSSTPSVNRDLSGLATVNLISVPSIFYGSSIKKGTVNLKFLISGSVLAELKDEKENGELVQTGPAGSAGSGSTQGIVLYNEGFFLLTGSDALHGSHTENYLGAGNVSPRWIYFATTGSSTSGTGVPSSSFAINFSGTNYVENLTMFAHARKGELNHSNNPTYIKSGSSNSYLNIITGSSNYYKESDTIQIKNVVSSAYDNPTGSFEKTTYISQIGIYDKDKNLIGVTKLATPIKKTSERGFTFKIKLDI